MFVPLRVNAPLPESANALLLVMFPANVVEPEGGGRSQISIAIAGRGFLEENLSGSPKAEARAGAAMLKAVAVGRFSPLPSSNVPPEIVVKPL